MKIFHVKGYLDTSTSVKVCAFRKNQLACGGTDDLVVSNRTLFLTTECVATVRADLSRYIHPKQQIFEISSFNVRVKINFVDALKRDLGNVPKKGKEFTIDKILYFTRVSH